MTNSELVARTYENRSEVTRSSLCACFNCFARFAPTDIVAWCHSQDPRDEDPGALRPDCDAFPGSTAVCPKCEHDTVLGDACGEALTDERLRELKLTWYSPSE